jgi:hypothetical protein
MKSLICHRAVLGLSGGDGIAIRIHDRADDIVGEGLGAETYRKRITGVSARSSLLIILLRPQFQQLGRQLRRRVTLAAQCASEQASKGAALLSAGGLDVERGRRIARRAFARAPLAPWWMAL